MTPTPITLSQITIRELTGFLFKLGLAFLLATPLLALVLGSWAFLAAIIVSAFTGA